MKFKTKQKKLALLIVLSLFLGYLTTRPSSLSTPENRADLWRKVIGQGNPLFELLMPGTPQHTIRQVAFGDPAEVLPTASILSEDLMGHEYIFNITALSEPLQRLGNEAIFKELIKLLTTPENTLLLSFNMASDRADFQIDRKDQGVALQGHIRIKDRYLFLQSLSYKGEFPVKSYTKFIESLQLK